MTTVLIQLNHVRNPSITLALIALGSAGRPVPPPILHTDSSGGLQRAAGAGSLRPHSTWEKASPPRLVTAEQHRWLSPLKPGHVPAPPVRKPLSPPPKGVSFSERSRIKWESASQLLCSQPLSLRLSNRSPARLRATLQIYPQQPRQRHTLPPSQGGGGPAKSPPTSLVRSLSICAGEKDSSAANSTHEAGAFRIIS